MPKKVYRKKKKVKKTRKVKKVKAKIVCIACGDTGINSKGKDCFACQKEEEPFSSL